MATVVLYNTATREVIEVVFHYGAANTATDMFNLVVCPLYEPLTEPIDTDNQHDLMWDEPTTGCVVLVERLYRRNLKRRISLSLSS